MTPWMPLQNYKVKFDCSVNVVVQMDVHRETGDLLPSELKLVVMQVSTCPRVIPALSPMWCDNIVRRRETAMYVHDLSGAVRTYARYWYAKLGRPIASRLRCRDTC